MIHYPNVTRAELRERIGISNDALEHLLKRNVIRPVGEVQGRGNRRTFAADDVMIAAIAAELHRYDISIGLLTKLSLRLYDGVGMARPLGLKTADLAEAREAVERQLAQLEREANAAFDAYCGVSTDPAAAPLPLKLKAGSSVVEAITGFDPAQLVALDLYLDLVDPRYLEKDPPIVEWRIASVQGSDDYRLSRHVGAESLQRADNRPSWITISLPLLARLVWLGE